MRLGLWGDGALRRKTEDNSRHWVENGWDGYPDFDR